MSARSDKVTPNLLWLLLCAAALTPSMALSQIQPPLPFTDVSSSDPWYNATTTLFQLGITKGCSGSGSNLAFCPNANISREDMAVLIVRAWSIGLWNDPEAFKTQAPPSSTPYFTDVPPTLTVNGQNQPNTKFLYVQKLYELGITAGWATGVFCPNATDNGFNISSSCLASGGTLANYQAAVFIARVRALIDNQCAVATAAGTTCSPNNYTWTTTPYFGDVPQDNYFRAIQRMGDLNAYNGVYSPTPYPGCAANCVFNEAGNVTRATMAMELVVGAGLDPRAALSFNGAPPTTGQPYTSTPPALTVPFTYALQPYGGGSSAGTPNTVFSSQFALADSSGVYHCTGIWDQGNDLNLYDGNTGNVAGLAQPQVDSFCTVSLWSIANATNPSVTNVVLKFTFSPTAAPSQSIEYTVMNQINYLDGFYAPWTSLGTLNVQSVSQPYIALSTLPNLSMTSGSSIAAPLTITTNGAVWGNVSLATTGLPSGLTVTPATVSVSPAASTSLSLTVQSALSTLPGLYSGTLTAAAGAVSQSIPISVNIPQPDPSSYFVSNSADCSNANFVYADGAVRSYCYTLSFSGDSRYLNSCVVWKSGSRDYSISAYASPFLGTKNFQIAFSATVNAAPGQRTVTCTWNTTTTVNGIPPLDVFDGTPTITGITPNPIPAIAQPQTIILSGTGFGIRPPALTITPALNYTIQNYGPTSITAQVTAPSPGAYLIAVTSTGNGIAALGFQSGGTTPSSPQGNPATLGVYVRPVITSFQTQTTSPLNYSFSAPVDAQSQGFLELFGAGFMGGSSAPPTVTIAGPGGTNWSCGVTRGVTSPCWLQYFADTQINIQYDFSQSPVYVGQYQIKVTNTVCGVLCGNTQNQNVQPFTVVPAILFSGTDVTGISSSVVVGQDIPLTTVAPLAPGVTLQSQSWTVQGTTLSDFQVITNVDATGAPTGLNTGNIVAADFSQAQATFFWVYPGYFRIVSFSAHLSNGLILTSNSVYNVYGPTVTASTDLGISLVDQVPRLAYGGILFIDGIPFEGNRDVGFVLKPALTPPLIGDTGKLLYVQILESYKVFPNLDEEKGCKYDGLDTEYPYAAVLSDAGVRILYDRPSAALPGGAPYFFFSTAFSATTYIMWKSELPLSKPVPLGFLSWNWYGDAARDGLNWILNPNGANVGGASQFIGSDPTIQNYSYPVWGKLAEQNSLGCVIKP